VLAKGKQPRQGKDAQIIYHFRTDRGAKPKLLEDGSVDFHELDLIARVEKDQLLATLKPPEPGEPGRDVFGEIIPPRQVKNKVLQKGRNQILSEDGLSLYSEVSGHATIEGGQIFVADIYHVPANVDNSTGDIRYDGSVEIDGNVLSGFSVTASGDVMINGVVEGAQISAGGQIILKRGIQGMGKGVLTAGSNIIAKFIENCEVKAGGFLSTDAILHSNVTAKGDITVDGKRGFVTGGSIRSGNVIRVKTAGSTMSAKTTLEVGMDPELMDEYRQIEKNLEEREKEKKESMQILALYKKRLNQNEMLSPEKMRQARIASLAHQKASEECERLLARQQELEEMIAGFQSGRIKVYETAYPGVKIVISNAVYYIRNEIRYSQFVKEGADIKVAAL